MSVETYTFKGELDLLEKRYAELKKIREELVDFIESEEFLRAKEKFEKLLASFEEKIASLVEAVETAPPVVVEAPQTQQPAQTIQPQQVQTQPAVTATAVFSKALLVAVAILMVGVAAMKGYVPPESLNCVAIATVTLVSLPSILETVRKFAESKAEEEMKPVNIHWVHRNLSYIRWRYLGAHLLIKIQNQTRKDLPQYAIMGMDEALYNREKYLRITLSTEFTGIISKIVVACDVTFWLRKRVLISAIVQSRMALGRR